MFNLSESSYYNSSVISHVEKLPLNFGMTHTHTRGDTEVRGIESCLGKYEVVNKEQFLHIIVIITHYLSQAAYLHRKIRSTAVSTKTKTPRLLMASTKGEPKRVHSWCNDIIELKEHNVILVKQYCLGCCRRDHLY